MWTFRCFLVLLIPLALAAFPPALARVPDFTSAFPQRDAGISPRLDVVHLFFPLPENFSLEHDWTASLPGADMISQADVDNGVLLVAAALPPGTDFLITQLRLAVGGKLHHLSGPVMLGGLPHAEHDLFLVENFRHSHGWNIHLLRNETDGPIRILRLVDRPPADGVIVRAARIAALPAGYAGIKELIDWPAEKVDQWQLDLDIGPGEHLLLIYDTNLPVTPDTLSHHIWVDYESAAGRFSHMLFRISSGWPGVTTWLD